MLPDDLRHGANSGYTAGCRDLCCRKARADYERKRAARRYLARGPLEVDALGTTRRLQALCALGWPQSTLSARLGYTKSWVRTFVSKRHSHVYRSTAVKVAALYDELSMRLPEPGVDAAAQWTIDRVAATARTRGWAPPLAWPEGAIDNPSALPEGIDPQTVDADTVDPVVVERILAGDWTCKATPAERRAVLAAFIAADLPLALLEKHAGWKPERYRSAA